MMRGLVPRNRLRTILLLHDVTELGQRDVLDLTDAFSRHLEFPADFLECLRLAAVQTETQGQNLGLTRVEFFQDVAHFLPQRLVAQQFKWSQRGFVADDFAEFGRVIVANGRVEAGRER